MIWIEEVHRADGKHFVVHAAETLTAFLELELVIRSCKNPKRVHERGK
jgi:hypothetical protein